MVRSVRAVTKISRKASAFDPSLSRESLDNSISSHNQNKTHRSSRSSIGSSSSSSGKPHHEKGIPQMDDPDDVNEKDDKTKRLLYSMDEEHLLRFVKETHREILQRRNQRQQAFLRHALTTSRDAVLLGSSSGGGTNNESQSSSQPQRRIFPRLPSNSCPPQLQVPPQRQEEEEGEDALKLQTSVSVRMRGVKHQWGKPQRLQSILYLEGCHDPLPPSTSTIFLKTHYSTEDEQNLTYVPYFGDDDKEDVVSDVFDLARREKLMEYGTEYRERDTNDTIGETLKILQARLTNDARDLAKQCPSSRSNNINKMTMEQIQTQQKIRDMRLKLHGMVADIMNVSVDRINERYNALFRDHLENGAKAHAVGETATKNNGENQLSSSSSSPSSLERKKSQKHATEDESLRKNNNSSVLSKPPTNSPTKEYAEVMDSYQNLFCRRCFSYDCNMHGNLPKPNLDIQAELAVEKEKNGDWNEVRYAGSKHMTTLRVPL
eukprot:scaffold17185_cov56-Attheya_sp.AAC.11